MDKVEVVLGDLANLDAFNVEDTIDTIIHAGRVQIISEMMKTLFT